jgi:LPS sulfotransferase NodH
VSHEARRARHSITSRLRRYAIDDYVEAISRAQQTANGVFAVKTDFIRLIPFLASPMVSPVFVYVVRRDLVAQAVSFHRAFVTGQWSSLDALSGEAEFDLQAIRARMDFINEMTTHWERFFSLNCIAPLRLVYGEMLADPEGTVTAVARHIGVDGDIDTSKLHSRLATQRDDVSREWCDRFRAALALPELFSARAPASRRSPSPSPLPSAAAPRRRLTARMPPRD